MMIFLYVLTILAVVLLLLNIPWVQRVVVAFLVFATDPDGWNSEGWEDFKLMAFHPEQWDKLIEDIEEPK